jgi:hypothetical protein
MRIENKKQSEITAAFTAPVTNFTTWESEVGDITGGILIELKTVDTRFGEREIIVLENDEGRIDIWMSKVLKDEFRRLKIHDGDGVVIRFDGLKLIAGRAPLKNYSVWKLEDE